VTSHEKRKNRPTGEKERTVKKRKSKGRVRERDRESQREPERVRERKGWRGRERESDEPAHHGVEVCEHWTQLQCPDVLHQPTEQHASKDSGCTQNIHTHTDTHALTHTHTHKHTHTQTPKNVFLLAS
jgi:hypothetical protein